MLWVGVHLPALSLESFLATLAPAEAAGGVAGRDPDPLGPVALVERHRLSEVNEAARLAGLVPGQKRATALALAPRARLGEADPARDALALEAVAHAMMAFTPAVSMPGTRTVLAEVRASLRYFGGLSRLLGLLREALAAFGHCIQLACAPTPQAAQWLCAWRDDARAGAPAPRTRAEWQACIGTVPVALMDAAAAHLPALETLGLSTAACLQKQPRDGLARRFGAGLLGDIDRALGDLADPRTSLRPPSEFHSRLELFMRADDSAALLVGAAALLTRLTAWAAACHGRVGEFELRLHHETRLKTRHDPSARVTALRIGLGEPVSDTAHLQSLLRERLQRLPLAASVIELSLHCAALVPGAPPNAELFPSAASVGEGWQRLLERFEARLGPQSVQRLRPVADHRPERATASSAGAAVRPSDAATAAGAAQAPLDLAEPPAASATASGDPAHWPRLRRPVWLLPEPQPLREESGTPLLGGRALWLVAGPERIETGWWEGALTARDYFIAQGDDGALLWIYRFRHAPVEACSGWFLHGRFG